MIGEALERWPRSPRPGSGPTWPGRSPRSFPADGRRLRRPGRPVDELRPRRARALHGAAPGDASAPARPSDGRPVNEHVDRRLATTDAVLAQEDGSCRGRARRSPPSTASVARTDEPRPRPLAMAADAQRWCSSSGPPAPARPRCWRATQSPRSPRGPTRSSGWHRRARRPTCSPGRPAVRRPGRWPSSSHDHGTGSRRGARRRRDDGRPRRGGHGLDRGPRPPRRPGPTGIAGGWSASATPSSCPPSAEAACSPTGATPSRPRPRGGPPLRRAVAGPGQPAACARATRAPSSTYAAHRRGSSTATRRWSPSASPAATNAWPSKGARSPSRPRPRTTARAINVEPSSDQPAQPAAAAVGSRDGTRARVGDRIATRRNDPALVDRPAVPVRNRQTWTVDRRRAPTARSPSATPSAAGAASRRPTSPATSSSAGPSPATATRASPSTTASASSSRAAAEPASTSA